MKSFFTFALLICAAVVLPPGVRGEQELQDGSALQLPSSSDRQVFGCTGLCFIRLGRAVRQCGPLRRAGGFCNVVACTRANGINGFQCVFLAPPPTMTPPIFIAPTLIPVTTAPPTVPAPSATPSMSPTVTPSSGASPTPTATPSPTPSTTISPTPSQSCSFALSGPIGQTAIDGVCTCGTTTATVIVLAPVSNDGASLPPFTGSPDMMEAQMEALNCYNGCITDLFDLACDPGSVATFASDGQAIVDSCCTNCASDEGDGGMGINRATNQCRLAVP